MIAHIDDRLDAYLDGELSTARAHQVEAHLQACPACREQLARRQRLSALLARQSPAPAPLKSEARFVSEVALQLERRGSSRPPASLALHPGWLAVPLGVLLAVAFIQALLVITTLLALIPGGWQALSAPAGLLTRVPTLPEPVSGMLGLAAFASLPAMGWGSLLLAALLLSVLYLGWLAGWFARTARRSQTFSKEY